MSISPPFANAAAAPAPATTPALSTAPRTNLIAAMRSVEVAWLLGLMVAGLALRLPYLWTIPRFTDESREVLRAIDLLNGRLTAAERLVNVDAYIGGAYTWMLAAVFTLTGVSALSPRLIMAIAGALAVGFTYLLARDIGGRAAGIVAAGLLATSGGQILSNGHIAWSHCLTPTLTTLATWLLLRGVRDGSRAALLGSGFTWGLALQTHPATLVLLPGATVYVLWSGRRLLKTPWPYVAAVLFVAAFANVIVYNLMTGGGTFREAATVRERYDAGIVVDIVTYFKNHLPHGLMQLRYLAGAVDERAGALAYILDPTLWLYGGLALAGLIYCARRGAPLLLLMTLSSFLIMPYFNQRKYVPISDGRYLMPLLPLAYAATGTLLATGWNRLRDRDPAWRYGMIAGAALLVLYPLAPLTRYYGQELAAGRTNEPLLRVVQEVGANRRPDEPVVLDRDLADIKLEGGGTAFRSIRFLLAGIGIDDRSVDSVTDYAEKMPPGTSALLVTDSRGVKNVQQEVDRLRAVGVQTETAVRQRVDGDYAAIRLEHGGPAAQADDGSQHAQFPTAYSAPLGRSGLSVYAAPGTARLDQTGQSHTSGGEPMAAPEAKAEDNQDAKPTSTVPIELFATSLVNPRGLAFRDDRSLLVALAGNGGPNEIDVGRDKPHRYGRTGELIRIDPTGDKFIMARNLPSIVTAVNEECGPSAVAFIEDRTYLLMASGGWDFGDPAFHSGVYELEPEGGLRKIWDMTEHVLANPAKARREDPRADVPAGMAYGMTAMGGRLYVTDANQEQLFEVDPSTGSARQVVEYPKSNRAMTGVAAGPDGALYVAEWASNKITRITTDGHISDGATKLRMPIGVTFGPDGAMYVVEFTGRVLRAAPVGEEQKDILAEGLRAPTAIAFGPDGNLYVSVRGQGSGQGEGEIIRLRLTPPDPNIERARWANAAAWMSGLLVFFLLLGTGWISQWRARRLRRNQPPGPPTA